MLNCPIVPPETGGMLGGKNGIICKYFFDIGIVNSDMAIYKPDVNAINKQISVWSNVGINFLGLAHTHPEGQCSLSDDDFIYIEAIMKSMPESVKFLYFPIIIPNSCLIPYKAVYDGKSISVTKSKLKIISEEVKK